MSTPTTRASIRRLKLTNFKAFQSFDLTFRGDAFLVGPNNAGKSTLIEAMRGAAAMLRHASLRRPDFTRQDHGNLVWAYKLTAQRSEIENLLIRIIADPIFEERDGVEQRTRQDYAFGGLWALVSETSMD